MPNIVVSTIRGVWFLIFFIIAWRARALTGKNFLAAIAAGFGAAVLGLAAANFLDKNGLSVRFNSGIKMQPVLLESFYLALFPVLFALVRRLRGFPGFGRDFWLVVAFMAPLVWVMVFIMACVIAAFHPGPM